MREDTVTIYWSDGENGPGPEEVIEELLRAREAEKESIRVNRLHRGTKE
jgi:hypothetical protein